MLAISALYIVGRNDSLFTYYIYVHVYLFCAKHVATTWNGIICAYILDIINLFL